MPGTTLFSPLQLAGVTCKNRLFSAPTSLAELAPGSHLSHQNIQYYRLKAAGGCAVVTVGESIVDTGTGLSHPMQIALDDPGVVPSLAECAAAIHSHGALASIELSHGGALCGPAFLGHNAFGPSAFVDAWGDTVEEMTEEDILRVAEAFGTAAARAKACSFDLVMVHGGHGWLVHQFLSPLTNRRTDAYGGNFENRMRFPLLVVQQVRAAVGRAFPIEFRMSGDERTAGGYGIETGIAIAKALDGKVDLLHVSAGTQADEYSAILMHPGVFQKEGENAAYARAIKKHVKTPVVTVGGFATPSVLEETLTTEGADAIAMGRALLADPFLPKKWFAGRPQDITPCLRCGECQSGMFLNRMIRCSVNPLIGREEDFFHPLPVHRRKTVLVAGGGPGGLQAALTAQARGHRVVLCEAKNTLGGALSYADAGGFKTPMKVYRDSQVEKIQRSGAEVLLKTPLDEKLLREYQPDVLIVAAGAAPLVPPIPGITAPHVLPAAGQEAMGLTNTSVVVIGGGLVGCEEALHLAGRGCTVTLLEMRDTLAPDCGHMHRINLLHQLAETPAVTAHTGMRCTSIGTEEVEAEDEDGKPHTFPAGAVLLAAGMRADDCWRKALPTQGLPYTYIIGDAHRPGKVMQAVQSGYDAAVDAGLY